MANRRKVILPVWSGNTAPNINDINEIFEDFGTGELLLNISSGNPSIVMINDNNNIETFITNTVLENRLNGLEISLENLIQEVEDNELVTATAISTMNASAGFNEDGTSALPNGASLTKYVEDIHELVNDFNDDIAALYNQKVDKTTTVNGQALSSNVTITKVNSATTSISATTAVSASTSEKAYKDGSGNVISSTYASKTELENLIQEVEDSEFVTATALNQINTSVGLTEGGISQLPNQQTLTEAIIDLQNKTKDLEESDPIFTDSPAAGITGDDIENWDNKLDKDGKAVSAQTADFATDLSGRVEATPEEFTFRPSAGNKSIRDDSATIKRIKGNSIVWNQMISTPPVMPYTNRCNLSISGNDINATVNSIEYDYVGFYYSLPDYRHPKTVNGHTYFISVLFSCPKQATVSFGVGSSSIKQLVPANTLYSYNTIQKQTSDAVGAMFTCWIEDIQVDDTFKVQNWNVIDLTQMFGAGNEPTTVDEFRALYPDSYYPYNAGELRNLDCNGIKTVGFNQWDEQWERGSINQEGGDTPSTTMFRSVGYMQILQQKYCVKQKEGQVLGFRFYDENKVHISGGNRGVVETITTLIPPLNAAYMRFVCTTSNTYNHDICINLHHTGYRDGEYEPYKEVTHSLPLSQITNGEPLRKAGSVYDEINETHYINRVGTVDLGELEWVYSEHLFGGETVAGFKTSIEDVIFANAAATLPNITVSKYSINTADKVANGYTTTDTFTGYKAYKTNLYAYFTFTTDASEFKASLAGVMLNYELAEPIVIPIEAPIDFNYYVEDFGTEEALLTEDSAPFNADIIYQFNAVDRIRQNDLNINRLVKELLLKSDTWHTHSEYATTTALNDLISDINRLDKELLLKSDTGHTHSEYATTTALNDLISDIEDNELIISTIVTKINDSCGFNEDSESVLPNGQNLTEAIIELQRMIQELQAKNDELENRIKELENK